MGYQPVDIIIGKERAADFLRIGLKQQMQTIETVDISGARIEMLNSGKDAGHVTFNPSKFVDLPNYVITSYSIHYTKLYDNITFIKNHAISF